MTSSALSKTASVHAQALWAKSEPYHPLWKHLLDAAAVSLALPNPLRPDGWSAEQLALVVGLHDVGKADSAFQFQDERFRRGHPDILERLANHGFIPTTDARCRHERLSAYFLREKLKANHDDLTASAIARAVLAHHGYWIECDRSSAPAYEEAQDALCQMLETVLGVSRLPAEIPTDLSAFGIRLAGHIVLSDWIASNEDFFADDRLKDLDDPVQYFERAKEVGQTWVGKLGLIRSDGGGDPESVVATPRPIQQALLDHAIPPGLVVIEAPMGEGKTEAAWILAEKWRDAGYNGMYMALPTMATSDSLYERYGTHYLTKLGRNEQTHLVHGMAWLRDDREPKKPPQTGELGDDQSAPAAWFRPTRRAMLAAHGVGTVDQAMLAGMNVKFGFLRLYGLDRKVLVIDEVHAYDAYMSAIIGRLLQWCACLRIPVILLSATLSEHQRQSMIAAYRGTPGPGVSPMGGSPMDSPASPPYPLITVAPFEGDPFTIPGPNDQPLAVSSTRTLQIIPKPGLLGDAKSTARLAQELAKDGGCCCVILNTVKQAQAVYQALDDQIPNLLFHARFTAEDRQRNTTEVLAKFGKNATNRPDRFILVATQVVEQSLDVDFDHMISEIAPMDLLLQRSGRIKRHARTKDGTLKGSGPDKRGDPVLQVLVPGRGELEFGGTFYVYAEKPLLRTLAQITSEQTAELPRDFRKLIERTYGCAQWDQDATSWDRIAKADGAWTHDANRLTGLGDLSALDIPSPRYFRPVGNAPSGDDSDDGNGWRARTRLGANDRTAVLVDPSELAALAKGNLPKRDVKNLYLRAIKLPSYLPLFSPVDGYEPGVDAEGKLKGLILLPVDASGEWKGRDESGRVYQVRYDGGLGLLARRLE